MNGWQAETGIMNRLGEFCSHVERCNISVGPDGRLIIVGLDSGSYQAQELKRLREERDRWKARAESLMSAMDHMIDMYNDTVGDFLDE